MPIIILYPEDVEGEELELSSESGMEVNLSDNTFITKEIQNNVEPEKVIHKNQGMVQYDTIEIEMVEGDKIELTKLLPNKSDLMAEIFKPSKHKKQEESSFMEYGYQVAYSNLIYGVKFLIIPSKYKEF